MKLLVAPYNNGASTWTEAEETAIISYKLTHRFNEPAECTITLSDPTGVIARKYNTDANDVFVGAGKVTIEDPTGTDIFFGRILRAKANTDARTVELYCQDWLSQLDEEQITYDMREDLDGAGLRQSELHTDPNSAIYVGPAYTVDTAIVAAIQDDGGVFTADTTDANDADANDVGWFPLVPVANDGFLFGFDNTVHGIKINNGTAGVGTYTVTWQYSTGAGTWADLPGVTDGTNGFHNAGTNTVTWTVPSGWVTATYLLVTHFWVKAKLTSLTSMDTRPLGTQVWSLTKIAFDDDMAFANDAHNGKYMILSGEMAGNIKVRTPPYTYSTDASTLDTFTVDFGDLWDDDATNKHTITDIGGPFYVIYNFRVLTPVSTTWYQSCSAARVILVYYGGDSTMTMQLYNGATYDIISDVAYTPGGGIRRLTVEIPTGLLAGMFDANGECRVKLDDTADGGIYTYYIAVECDFVTSGHSGAIEITDTVNPNLLYIDTDLQAAATKVWETLPYAIAKKIYKHIDSGESGTLVTAGDLLEAITCAATIEHTSGISTRQYKDQTRLSIVQDLARQDKAEFWITLGTATLNYKSTWNDSVADATLTDTDVNAWTMMQDYQPLVNKAMVYGMRIGDEQLSSSYSDATSIAKFVNTRTKVNRDGGIVSEYDALARATAIVNQYNSVQMLLTAMIAGNTMYAAHPKPIKLGDEVQVTSTYLGLTNSWYIVEKYDYDSNNNLTTLTMHPRVSATGLQRDEFTSMEGAMQNARRGGTADKYIPPPETNVI